MGYLATRTTLLDIYEKMIKYDYSFFLEDLSAKAEKYSVIVNNSDEIHEFTDALQDLSRNFRRAVVYSAAVPDV